MKPRKDNSAPFAFEGLDRVIHEPARLSVLTSLITHPNGLSFVELKRLCALTDGNLARHLQVLEEEAIIRISKKDEGGRAQTVARITAPGRKRYLDYLTVLEGIVNDAASALDTRKSGGTLRELSPLKT